MDEKTLNALKGSIAKWERIVRYGAAECGYHDCPLCHLFADEECKGCPVAEQTKDKACVGSPYHAARTAMQVPLGVPRGDRRHPAGARIPRTKEARRLARLELEFLKSLIPKEP